MVVDVVGISPFLREKEARFLVEVEKAAGSFKVLQPEATELVRDHSPHYRDSLLFIEAHLLHGDVQDLYFFADPRTMLQGQVSPPATGGLQP